MPFASNNHYFSGLQEIRGGQRIAFDHLREWPSRFRTPCKLAVFDSQNGRARNRIVFEGVESPIGLLERK